VVLSGSPVDILSCFRSNAFSGRSDFFLGLIGGRCRGLPPELLPPPDPPEILPPPELLPTPDPGLQPPGLPAP